MNEWRVSVTFARVFLSLSLFVISFLVLIINQLCLFPQQFKDLSLLGKSIGEYSYIISS